MDKLKTIKLFILPIIIYSCFIILRIKGIQPEAESEMGDYITSINFIFGGSIAYLMHVLITLGYTINIKKIDKAFWVLISIMLYFLAFDEVFMIHESIAKIARIPDAISFLMYGLILIIILSMAYKYYTKSFYLFIIMFGLCSIISIVSDTLLSEGTILIMGNSISYEQFSESFGALFLSASIICLLLSFLRENPLNLNYQHDLTS